jgi:hypothetical protein
MGTYDLPPFASATLSRVFGPHAAGRTPLVDLALLTQKYIVFTLSYGVAVHARISIHSPRVVRPRFQNALSDEVPVGLRIAAW